MIATAFYERRRRSVLVNFCDRRVVERRNQENAVSPEKRRLATQVRRYERESLSISVFLNLHEKKVKGITRNISSQGILIGSDEVLSGGTPMALKFSFGENFCYMNISGQVVFCLMADNGPAGRYTIGIKFTAVHEWEERVLASTVQELKLNPATLEKSLLTIDVSKDAVAFEAASFSIATPSALVEKFTTNGHLCTHASKVIGWGSYLPPTEITSKDITARLSVSGYKNVGEVVEAMTGLKTRRYAGQELYASDLAAEASLHALKGAGMDPMDLDAVIYCGVTRDFDEPATANLVQDKIGAKRSYVFDLSNACNGFLSSLDVADSLIASGRYNNVLVTAGELGSSYVDWEPESKKGLKLSAMGYTLGDGGGAAVVSRIQNGEDRGIVARWFLSDGSYWRTAIIPPTAPDGHRFKFKSDGAEIERVALKYVPVGVREVLNLLKWNVGDIDLFIPHQVSVPVIEKLYTILKVPSEKVVQTFPKYGNVGAASMPIAMCDALKEGRVKPHGKVLFVGGSGGFGAGVLALVM